MFNSDVSVETFLNDYWQKKPLLFRNAFPDFKSPVSADELAGLACEEESNARLIIESDQTPYWSVEYSPFSENRFSELPTTNWTLLVSDVEKHFPEGRELLDHFRFIPEWRIDDLMLSYAVKGGSVGPHLDAYDVFLLQAEGQRHWGISDTEKDSALLKDIDLRILSSFKAQTEWTLNPGDMLYLPPNIAHHGVAIDDCITCSIGFRAPSVHTIISEYAETLASALPQDLRYSDNKLTQQHHSAEITEDTIASIRQLLITHLQFNDDSIKKWLGEHITESNIGASCYNHAPPNQAITNLSDLNNVQSFSHALTSKILFSQNNNHAFIFIDGQSHETSLVFAQTLCQSHNINNTELLQSIQNDKDESVLMYLISHGYIICAD